MMILHKLVSSAAQASTC